MIRIEALAAIKDKSSVDNIQQLTNCLVEQVKPLKVILFGSFADGSYTDESDYDFYLVVDDRCSVSKAIEEAYNAVMYVKNRPVDIVVGTNSNFEGKGRLKHSLMIEGEVQRKGILLYERSTPKNITDMTAEEITRLVNQRIAQSADVVELPKVTFIDHKSNTLITEND